MTNWADRMVESYKDGMRKLDKHRRKLPEDHVDRSTIGGMLADMALAIDHMQRRYVTIGGRRRYRPPVVLDTELFPSLAEPEVEWQPTREQVEQARVALKRLTKRERDCFVLHSQGFSLETIGNKLGISRQTVRIHVARAKSKIPSAHT